MFASAIIHLLLTSPVLDNSANGSPPHFYFKAQRKKVRASTPDTTLANEEVGITFAKRGTASKQAPSHRTVPTLKPILGHERAYDLDRELVGSRVSCPGLRRDLTNPVA